MKRGSPALIGAFVIGAVTVAMAAVLLIGSGQWFTSVEPFILYFPGAVDGLNVGAPVRFRGVGIGSVTKILLHYDQAEDDQRIPVFIELDEDKVASAGGAIDFSRARIQDAIDRGLRAQLQSESILTGLLFVQLDFLPESKAHYFGLSKSVREIPTVPTTLEQAQSVLRRTLAKLEQIDFDRIVTSAENTIDAIERLVTSPELKEALASLDEAVDSVRLLSDELRADARPALQNFVTTAERARQTLGELDRTLEATRAIVAPESPIAYQLGKTLQEISQAARSIRALADTLERDPTMLLRGRTTEGREK